MKVIEVIDKCEKLLEVNSTTEDLLECFNLVENELALNYLPLYAIHQCHSKIVYFNEFEYAPVRIVMCNCKYKLHPTHMESKKEITNIQYSYTPNKKDLYDECSYDERALDCLTYGVVAEYLLNHMYFDEAALWHKKYKKEIELLML